MSAIAATAARRLGPAFPVLVGSGIGLLSAAAFDVYSNWEMPRSVMVARESSMERAFGLATPAMAGRYHAHQHGFSADRH